MTPNDTSNASRIVTASMSQPPQDFVRLDRINNDLDCLRQVLDNPNRIHGIIGIMDVIRLALSRVHQMYSELESDMRRSAKDKP